MLVISLISNESVTDIQYDDPNLNWEFDSINFTAFEEELVLKFIPWDNDGNLMCDNSGNGGLGMAIDKIAIELVTNTTQTFNEIKDFIVSPNPTFGKIYLDVKDFEELQEIRILDANGKLVYLKSNFENLDIILSGPIPPNPSELLSLEKMKSFIEELKKTYQHIIIDTPPIGLVTDGLILMKHCDVNIYVVRQNFTTKDMLYNFNETVIENDVVNMNLIINDISIDKTSYGYGYGYGNTYGYGYYTEDQTQDKKPWWKI